MSTTIKVMTFNLRIRVEADGKNCFDYRKDKILDVINRESPDLIGFQEAGDTMLSWLKESLTEYCVLGHGRKVNYKGEGIPIAYKKSLFDLHTFHEEWLSLFPNKPESLLHGLDQSPCPRTFCYAELIHKDSDTPLAFYNIHTDHRGAVSRVLECAFLMRSIGASAFRYVLTGDFNALPESPEIHLIRETAEELGTVDATSQIKGSFHAFRGDVEDQKIDYIFTNLPTDPQESYAVEDDDSCGCYYSDHHALCAFVEI